MAHWSLPIPGLDPLYDLQLKEWRRTFDFGGHRLASNPESTLSPLSSWAHAHARNRSRQVEEEASRNGRPNTAG